MTNLVLILPWLLAGALAYWKMETNYSVLKAHDTALYDKVIGKDGKKVIEEEKNKLDALKKEIETEKKALETYNETNKDKISADSSGTEATKSKEDTQALEKKQKQVEIIENLDKGYYPVYSVSNIGWTLGIFFIAGGILHFVTKKVMELFNEKGQ